MNAHRSLLSFVAFLTLLINASFVSADVTIDYGVEESGIRYIDLLADTPDQVVLLFGIGIASDGGADGFELDVQIGDGGDALGGTDAFPTITDINLINGTIWESFSPNQADVVVNPLARQSTVDTASLVAADGLIGTLVIDTTGMQSGEINFLLSGVAGSFNSNLSQGTNVLTTIAPNGIIRIVAVPEPTSFVAGMFGLIGLALRRRRHSVE
ncbi:MAG: hypothetical protein ACI87E_001756 [Mariniblastus sp.]|jgi:hypothetical protein